MEQHGQHRGIDAARNTADDGTAGHDAADSVDDFALEVIDAERRRPSALTGNCGESDALLAVGDLGVELDAEEALVPLQGDGHAVLVVGEHLAPSGRTFTVSEWLIQTWEEATPLGKTVLPAGNRLAGPYSRGLPG